MPFTGPVNYSLYLVTGRELLPPGADYYQILEEALKGGVTLVQVREKDASTREFLEIAQRTKEICHEYNVPVLINDRIDIALAMGADGVHIGQSDMPANIARWLLPANLILGISANTPGEAAAAVADGADYIGIGPIWSTTTKKDIKNVLGVRGVGAILDALDGSKVKAVGIAGINEKNVLRTLHGTVSKNGRALDGVAVVSALMASKKPHDSAKGLSDIVRAFLSSPTQISRFEAPSKAEIIVKAVADLLSNIRETGPVIHQITNNVVINQSANVTLALGASPIMATAPQEMEDLSKVSRALLVNFGTISSKEGMLEAGKWVNARKNPIVFDPVAVGATKYRFETAQELLNTWQASVIKGNPAEIGALAQSDEVKSRGVDSVGSGFENPVPMLCELARKERCVIAMTGKADWVSDGNITISSSNGHELLANITGSGCIVGTSVATFCAAANNSSKSDSNDADHNNIHRLVRGDMLLGAVGGILAITVASELAAARNDVHGTGTFLPALIDELYHLTPEKLLERARVEVHS
ncbi:HK-domain-containing protein [Fomitiporia mediterranea MF3/22]|uniref:HK-domain-containing protein n=1 Tax=Fomitiporia mediterranea (strain MF3/22) TaxID=694068 RepID=UPI0004407CC7|nr:HK-domain-containing protein [Fomitiporia mediterranea MF3/22]EJD03055.1 HK-domain-containing protein [Fomitiporia mediterranea MF3/22]